MEITFKTSELRELLKLVGNTYGNKDKPIMDNVYLKADSSGDNIAITSNGHEATKTIFNAKVIADGEGCVEVNALIKLANTFTDGEVTIKVLTNHAIQINHPDGEIELASVDPSQFIQWADPKEESKFVIDSKEFEKALKKVEFARIKNPIGGADAKLGGIGFTIANGKGTLACTDRRRIAKITFDTPKAQDIEVVLPPEMIPTLKDLKGNIEVKLADNGVAFSSKDTTIKGGVIAQSYPDVGRFFGQAPASTVIAPLKALRDVLERIQILSKVSKSSADAEFSFKSTGIDVTYKPKNGRGKIDESITIVSHTGNSMVVNLNVDVVIDVLKRMDQDNVEIELHASKKPVIMYPEGDKSFGFLALPIV